MPHSGGGGSHGGGSHGGSHRSGGSGSSNRVSQTYFRGAHRFVYYYHGRPNFYFANRKVTPNSIEPPPVYLTGGGSQYKSGAFLFGLGSCPNFYRTIIQQFRAVLKYLPGKFQLFLCREFFIELFRFFFIYKISLWSLILSGDTVKISGYQLPAQKE